jgi:ribonuclease BN (tRNA processing enzyme)
LDPTRQAGVRPSSTLYIAGSSAAVPRPNRANSGYLIKSGTTALALELGSGALARLLSTFDVAALDALLVSHMHADHFFDIVPMRYALKYEIRRAAPLSVFLPPGGLEKLHTVVSPLEQDGSFFNGIMHLAEYAPHSQLDIGDAEITFARTRHYIDAYAMRVQLPDGVLVFSSDTAPTQSVVDIARDADLFLCECGLGALKQERDPRGHSNAKEAGAMAQSARVKHLVLTHYSSSVTPEELASAARSSFGGQITIADDGMEVPILYPSSAAAFSRRRNR